MVGCIHLLISFFTKSGGDVVFMLSRPTGPAQDDGFPPSGSVRSKIRYFDFLKLIIVSSMWEIVSCQFFLLKGKVL